MAGLRDIAKKVGMSVSTVSKAMSGATDISAKTRKMILEAAIEMGYPVDSVGIPRRSGVIGIICPEVRSDYYAQILSIMENRINEEGYSLSVVFTNFSIESERKALQNYIKNKVSGIILLTEDVNISDVLRDIKDDIMMPVVLIAVDVDDTEFDNLVIDEYTGIKLAVDHLLELGHTEIGFISDKLTFSRLQHFRSAMRANGLAANEAHIYVPQNGKRFGECGYDAAMSLLSSRQPPTAIIAGYDDIAIGAMRAVFEKGLRIPDDISLIGIDNIRITPYLAVALTTVACPIAEMTDIAAKIMFRKIQRLDYTVVQHVVLRPRLIVRESTGKCKKTGRNR